MKSLLNKRIAVFGAGAVGCYFGLRFLESGFHTDFIGRGERLRILKEKGLSVSPPEKPSFNLKVNAHGALQGIYDVILICVKSKDTAEAAALCRGHLTEKGFAVSLQNGVENPALIASVLGERRTVPSSVYLTASMDKKGVLSYMSEGKIIYGPYGEEGSAAARDFGLILEAASVNHKFTEDIKTAQWRKLMFNLAANPLTALLGMTCGELASSPEGLSLARSLFSEGRRAAIAENVNIGEEEFEKIVAQWAANPDFKTSMLQDIESNRSPETDAVLGAVVRALARKGEKAPCCETVLKIMEARYGGWFQTSPRLAADVLVAKGDEVLLIERKNKPFGWAVPGGFADLFEKTEEAALRELKEETGISADIDKLELLGVYSNPARDPRGHTVSVVYLYRDKIEPKAGDDAKNAAYFRLNALPSNIAFDHRRILEDYAAKYNIS